MNKRQHKNYVLQRARKMVGNITYIDSDGTIETTCGIVAKSISGKLIRQFIE